MRINIDIQKWVIQNMGEYSARNKKTFNFD